MRIKSRLLFALMFIISSLNADVITLSNGKDVKGQLIKVTSAGLIVELRSDKNRLVGYRTFKHFDVSRIIDESGKTLYENGELLIYDLEKYYGYSRLTILDTKPDTIRLTDQSVIVVNIARISDNNLYYRQGALYYLISSLNDVESINGIPAGNYTTKSPIPVKRRLISYPNISVTIGIGTLNTHLNILAKQLQLAVDELPRDDLGQVESIKNDYTFLDLGFYVHINPNFSIGTSGIIPLNFDNDNSYDKETEYFRLSILELRYYYPFERFRPWIGIGYALQSIHVISRLGGLDAKWKCKSHGIAICTGFEYVTSDYVQLYVCAKYLPFSEKKVDETSTVNINLANLIFSGGIQFIL